MSTHTSAHASKRTGTGVQTHGHSFIIPADTRHSVIGQGNHSPCILHGVSSFKDRDSRPPGLPYAFSARFPRTPHTHTRTRVFKQTSVNVAQHRRSERPIKHTRAHGHGSSAHHAHNHTTPTHPHTRLSRPPWTVPHHSAVSEQAHAQAHTQALNGTMHRSTGTDPHPLCQNTATAHAHARTQTHTPVPACSVCHKPPVWRRRLSASCWHASARARTRSDCPATARRKGGGQ